MTQPPDDRRPMPWETPPEDAGDAPTVPWGAPGATPAAGTGPEPTPPAAPSGPGWAPPPPADGPTGPGWAALPGPATGPAASDAPPPPASSGPLLSSEPAQPSVAWGPPPSPVREVAPGLSYADTASRVVGYIVDVFLVGIVAAIIGGLLGFVESVDQDGVTTLTGGFELAVLSIIVGGLYFVASWSGGRRATLGQRIFSIQVGNAPDGAPLTLEQAVRRWLGYGQWLGLFGFTAALESAAGAAQFIWVLVMFITTATSPTKQGIHDRIANSAAVRPSASGRGLAFGCLVALAAIVVLVGLLTIVALFLVRSQMSEILEQIGESI